MTLQSPRIYVYKITFEEVPYYYYGVHKEKKFNEYYMGSPITNSWAWSRYTPKKQILQFFEFSDEGYSEANKIEQRLIRPVYNTDKWCLNENCGGIVSLDVCRKTGINTYILGSGIHAMTPEERIRASRLGGEKSYELGLGVHARTKEQMKLDSKNAGKKAYELGVGVHARTKEQMQEQGRINGTNTYLLSSGIHAQTPEERLEICSKGGKKVYELGLGVHARTKEQMVEQGTINYELGLGLATVSKEQLRENIKKVNSQKWMCLVTGYVSNPGGLNSYQKARRIDRSNRVRLST
jgi:general stress protein YciG/IS1 family transposase